MPPEVNPFQPPEINVVHNSTRVSADFSSYTHWPIVFAMNVIVPIILGWGISGHAGRQGILLACGLILLFGWGLCYRNAESANRLIRGSLLLTFTQVFPVLQLAIGFVGLKIASWVTGKATIPPDDTEPPFFEDALTSELEGFVVTFFVGTTLIACAYAFSILLTLISSKTDEQEAQEL